MSDPRVVDPTGTLEEFATYDHDTSIVYDATKKGGSQQAEDGLAVTLTSDKKVGLVGDGEAVEGLLILVEPDGRCSVQTGGYMPFKAGTGASLGLDKKIVGALLSAAKGYIREVATGVAAELGVARGRIIDNDDTSAVIVKL